jgi:predicted Zn-dependent protease
LITGAGFAIALCLLLHGCAINPATGKRQLVLISEAQEIAIGRESDESIVAQFGLYPDEALQDYVAGIGHDLAARSERPDLDWTFRVLDDPLVNAFALPGGYIYVTRGILAHFNSEAELASVLGHEIGHVTARHGVNQMSKAQLAQLGLGVASILAPEEVQKFGGLATQGLGLLFLKFGRDDERQADDLGLRYIVNEGYDPRPMAEVFETLERVSRTSGGGRVPAWASTHPNPENRSERVDSAVAGMNRDFSESKVRHGEFLAKIDGVVFGEDPRHGFFKDERFYHPEMKFRMVFPEGWETVNTRQFVFSKSPEEDAMVQLTLSGKESAEEALRAFLSQERVSRLAATWTKQVNGLRASGGDFQVTFDEGTARGFVVFVEHDGRVFELLGMTQQDRWDVHRDATMTSLTSFAKLTDSRMLSVQPKRIEIVQLKGSMSVETFAQRNRASVPPETIAILNGVEPGQKLDGGASYKVVRGGETP